MSQGVVYKQWYKSVNLPSTPTLNVKHLNYIATRKGAIRNPGCSFGLWGKLHGQDEAKNIDNLRAAKKVVREASKGHTLYRAVLSVDDEAAKAHDLYARGTWQKLVTEKVGVFAKEMGIAPKDFCWAASMHYAKGHPHVHILYWDSSSQVRQEFIPPERFEIMAEHVRSEFGRTIFREDIYALREKSDEAVKAARAELLAFCREANVAQALNINNISNAKLDELGKELMDLAVHLPSKGALKYAYLPAGYKEKMDAFISNVMKIADFRRLEKQYMKLTDEISTLYGNGPERKKYNREQAQKKLYSGMGNSILAVLKDVRQELVKDAPADLQDLQSVVKTTTLIILRGSQNYQYLLDQLPKHRTPMGEVMSDENVAKARNRVVSEVCQDLRIRSKAQGYAHALSADAGDAEKKGIEKDVFRDLRRTVNGIVDEKLWEDSGYREQCAADAAIMMLLRLFRSQSQGAGQMQAQRDHLQHRRGAELSKTAQRDLLKKKEQEGGWTFGQ